MWSSADAAFQPGYSDAGAGNLVFAIEKYEKRRQRFGRRRIADRTGVESAQSHPGDQFARCASRVGIVATDEDVTVDVSLELAKLVRRDVLKC